MPFKALVQVKLIVDNIDLIGKSISWLTISILFKNLGTKEKSAMPYVLPCRSL